MTVQQLANIISAPRRKGRCEPFSLVHFITERCNARCRHCFIDFDNAPPQHTELNIEEIRQLTRKLGNSLYNVNITGGEPFLRDDLATIVQAYLENTPVRSIVITTNGWFTDSIRELFNLYAKIPGSCRLTISISIDDLAERHDASRSIPGLYRRAIESYHAVAGATDSRVRPDVTLTVTAANAGRVADIMAGLRHEGLTSVFPVMFREEGVTGAADDKKSIAEGYRKLCELADKTERPAKSLTEALHRAKNRLSRDIIHDIFLNNCYIAPCRAGTLFATIGADGSVHPCELLTGTHNLGNLREYDMDFLSLWYSGAARETCKQILKTECRCTFECAWTVNILANRSFWPKLLTETVRELL